MVASLVAFAAFAALLTVTPGLDTMYVVRTAAVSGRAAAFAAACGVGLGCLCWAAAGGLGVTALLTASDVAYDVLRWGGAAYLCYLGVRALWRSRHAPDPAAPGTPAPVPPGAVVPVPAGAAPDPAGPAAPARRPAGAALRVGLLTNLLNPKVGVFYLAALPQFMPRGVAPLPAALALGGVHVLEGLAWFALVIYAVRRAAGWFTRPVVRRRLDQVTGVVFIAFGVRLALARATG
jgi:threonine/homoserine/homoserine lactone efflux protein